MLDRCFARILLLAFVVASASACGTDDGGKTTQDTTNTAGCTVDADCAALTQGCQVGVCNGALCVAQITADDKACSDGDVCTSGEKCKAGACTGGAATACNDNNACTVDSCDPNNGCVYSAQPSKCLNSDNNPCTSDVCNPTTGACDHTPASGAICDDKDACTVGDTCKDGACKSGANLVCNDDNVCTDDSCDVTTGCKTVNQTAACNDGNACTEGDACLDGTCRAGKTATDCDDKNACTTDSCVPKTGCAHEAVLGDCEDGDACTQADTCVEGTCTAGQAKACDDGNACTTDSCDKVKGCVAANSTASCEDGDACTEGDACAAGKCAAGKAKVCDDVNPCTTDACDVAKGCTTTDNTAACDDGSACTTGDACLAGACLPGANTDCDDKNPCTKDSCDKAQGCLHANADMIACDDGDGCSTGDMCMGGKCAGAGGKNCDDGNVCTKDSCDPIKGCQTAAAPSACDDASACTTGDACQAGACVPGAATNCDDKNPCTKDSCDKVKGCLHANDDMVACDDGDGCSTGDMCMGGKCLGVGGKNCDDANACTKDTCDPVKGCQSVAGPTTCDDANACTTGDKCTGTVCSAGTAVGCDDKNPCTVDSCDAVKGCLHANAVNGTVCDDANAQTNKDACKVGVCVGEGIPTVPTCEDFCSAVTSACTGGNAQYASAAECVDYCKNLGKYPVGAKSDTSGDTVGCRLFHAGLASKDAASALTHCPHTGKTGAGVCGTLCENFCQVAGANCAATFTSAGDCATKCGGAASTGKVGDTDGATVQCSLNYAAMAAKDATQCASVAIPNGANGKCVAPKPVPKTWTVTTPGFAFDPADLVISVGDSVTFAPSKGFHTATQVNKGQWDSPPASSADWVVPPGGFDVTGDPQTVKFDTVGVIYYVCRPHGSGGMKSTITVK